MTELFKTVLILSLLGFIMIAFLLCLKPVTSKKFPANFQYYVWVIVLFTMLIPFYKLIPEKEVQKITPITPNYEFNIPQINGNIENTPVITPEVHNEEEKTKTKVNLFELLTYIWIFGVFIFIFTVMVSYTLYIIKKRKNSVCLLDNDLNSEIKKELKIKRNISVIISGDVESPMLVGVFFPKVYIPACEISEENMRMVLLHEFTHYKRKDLLIKWLGVFVNAIHWFNPFVYFLRMNISEACETACDLQVTKNMSEENKKLYMKTILELIAEVK